ncbi:MAG: transporter substrate-binding domain-containing protein [Pseudomonadota bacterium]
MRILRHFILLACLALASALGVGAPIEVFVNSFQEPKAWEDETGMHGYVVETAEAIFMDAEIDYVWASVPFVRAMAETRACKGLMVGVFTSPERSAFLAYSDSIVPDNVGLVTRAGNPFVYARSADLAGKTVTFLSGGIFGIDLNELTHSRLDPQIKSDVMLKKLVAGRTDVVILSPREQIPVAARQAGIPMNQLRVATKNLATLDNHIVACKNDPRYGPILARVNQSIAKLKASGEFDRIMKTYQKF